MTSTVDDWADAESAVRDVLDTTLADPGERPLADLLAAITDTAMRAVAAAAVVICILDGTGGHREAVACSGVGQLADELIAAAEDTGVLAEVTALPATLRLPAEPARAGSLTSALLGVPIIVRGQPAGGLYLAEPARTEFTDADVRVAELCAQACATVVERWRTAAANRRRERWYSSGALLAKELVAGQHGNVLQAIAQRVVELADADATAIIQHGAAEDTFVIVAAAGLSADSWTGQVFIATDSVTARVMATGRATRLADAGAVDLPDHLAEIVQTEAAMLIPLTGSGALRGVISISRLPGRPQYSDAEMGMATMFASTVALSLELAESQAQRDHLALIEERDRIARDLHDHVIQRLYAVGLSLQHVSTKVDEAAEQRLNRNVDELDETIKQIRSTIYQLTTPLVSSEISLRSRTEALVADLEPILGFAPRLTSHGAMEFGVSEDVIDDCIAVLREALTNVARHAHATQSEVAISVSQSTVRVEVRDDGVGLGEASRRSGLANLRARAERRGGFMQIRSSGDHGTWLLWSIPVGGISASVGG